jgi:hypothetical protein
VCRRKRFRCGLTSRTRPVRMCMGGFVLPRLPFHLPVAPLSASAVASMPGTRSGAAGTCKTPAACRWGDQLVDRRAGLLL